MISKFEFDVTFFRLNFPEFANSTTFPDATLQRYWNTAITFISNENYGALCGDDRFWALNLATAHVAKLAVNQANNTPSGITQSATIDKVSVTLVPPPVKTQFQWWLNLTPYGQELAMILQVHSAGGFHIGGLPEGSAFRKWAGIF
jgi:hypothetical protein